MVQSNERVMFGCRTDHTDDRLTCLFEYYRLIGKDGNTMIENKNMSNCPKNSAETKTDYLGETFGTKDVNAQMKAKSYDVLTKYMDELNIGLGTLSDFTGISKSTISRYRNGKVTYMTENYLYAICIALRLRTCQQRYLLKCAHISMPDEWGNERASAFIIRDFLDGCCYDENYTVANCNTRLAEISAPLLTRLVLTTEGKQNG